MSPIRRRNGPGVGAVSLRSQSSAVTTISCADDATWSPSGHRRRASLYSRRGDRGDGRNNV